jgi:hypothetical protein
MEMKEYRRNKSDPLIKLLWYGFVPHMRFVHVVVLSRDILVQNENKIEDGIT